MWSGFDFCELKTPTKSSRTNKEEGGVCDMAAWAPPGGVLGKMLPAITFLIMSLAVSDGQVHVARTWRFAGPFASGKAERAVDVVSEGWPSDGSPPNFMSNAAETFPSEFARGGRVGWQSVQALDSGVVDLQSLAGSQAAYVWAIGHLVVKSTGCVALRASGALLRAWVGNISIPLHQAGIRTTLGVGSHATQTSGL